MSYLQNPPAIAGAAIIWTECGDESDPSARLLAHIRIAGLDMHLEAWAVTTDADGMQQATEETRRAEEFDQLCTMMDTTFETVEIRGRQYILIATPYGA